MKKSWFVLLGMLLSVAGFSQSKISLNFNGGSDLNFNKYYSKINYEKIEDGGTDFNLGMDAAYRFSDRFRMRVEFKYGQMNYGQSRIGGEPTAKDVITLEYMDFNPRMDFRILQIKKLELFVSTGLKFECIINSDQKSYLADGSVSDTDLNYVDTDYDDELSGWVTGAILKYNLTKHIGVTMSPDYTLYFDELYYKNSGALQRLNINVGFEWTL